jgi:hypothetical protein
MVTMTKHSVGKSLVLKLNNPPGGFLGSLFFFKDFFGFLGFCLVFLLLVCDATFFSP